MGFEWTAASASPEHVMRRRRQITRSSVSPSHWPARGPCGIWCGEGDSRRVPVWGRAGGGPRPSSSGLSRVPSTKGRLWPFILRGGLAIGPRGADVSWCRGSHAVYSTSVVFLEYVYGHFDGSLVLVPARLGDLVASGSRGSRAEVCVELQVAYACASRHALFGWLIGEVSRSSSWNASSKATRVYHPRG